MLTSMLSSIFPISCVATPELSDYDILKFAAVLFAESRSFSSRRILCIRNPVCAIGSTSRQFLQLLGSRD